MFYLIFLNVLWAASYSAMKWGLESLAPMHLLFGRYLVAAIVLFFFSLGQLKFVDKKLLAKTALVGLIMAVAHALSMWGLNKSFAADASILYAFEPISAIIFARILLKEKMDIYRFLAIALAVIGFVILSDINFKNFLANFTFIGNFVMVVGVFGEGLFSPVAKSVVDKYPPKLVMTLALIWGTLFLLPIVLMTPAKSGLFSFKAMASVFYLAIVCMAIGWTAWMHFLKKYPVNMIAPTVFVQPVVGPFIAYFSIGEKIGTRVWIGGGIILVAVLLSMAKRKVTEQELISEGVH